MDVLDGQHQQQPNLQKQLIKRIKE